jgi:hypothetical protein
MASGHSPFVGLAELARRVWSFILINRTLVRAALTSIVLAATGASLAGCDTDEMSLATNAKANQPISP